jgi:molecular chaperone GrpE
MADPNDFLDDPEAAEAEAYANEMEEIDEDELALEEIIQERDQYKDRLIRALADAENARKRSDKDRREAENYGGSKLARDMLSVYDNMKRALESATEEQRAVSGPLLEGVDLTMRELVSVFKKHGMEVIQPEVGDRFDPKFHQAMFEAPVPNTKAGEIIQVAAEGFMLHDRLLRPAQVGVSSTPA